MLTFCFKAAEGVRDWNSHRVRYCLALGNTWAYESEGRERLSALLVCLEACVNIRKARADALKGAGWLSHNQ